MKEMQPETPLRIGLSYKCPLTLDMMRDGAGPGTKFCEECGFHVHLISAMRESEARRLLGEKSEGRRCLAYQTDGRGNVITRPDPPSAAATLRRGPICFILFLLVTLLAHLVALAERGSTRPRSQPLDQLKNSSLGGFAIVQSAIKAVEPPPPTPLPYCDDIIGIE